ncbi:Putative tRNA pseudouridine synthase Pus10 [Ooceraea biroi]|uniref:Putative tRNA pseudouridine synthase Pus10 n=1 Tax=Ooceraea biroi TaxID=2015173 RepID=A0A026WFX0_OOCBI|nr:Putative tRNA pseudouridine synthase Pus10 [Ooceraea biroi]
MNIISTKEEETVLRFLKSHGCCLRCRLRFMGCRTTQCNFSEFAARADHTDVSDNISSEQETPCVVCLGILQDKIQETVIAKIADKVEQNDYDCGTFTCALTIPVSIRLREHILYAYMSKETNIDESIVSVLRTKLQNVKDVWKLFTIPKLEQAIRKRADLSMPSPFLVEVFLEHDDDKTIFNELMDKHKGCSNKQRRSKHNDNKFSRKNNRDSAERDDGRATQATFRAFANRIENVRSRGHCSVFSQQYFHRRTLQQTLERTQSDTVVRER